MRRLFALTMLALMGVVVWQLVRLAYPNEPGAVVASSAYQQADKGGPTQARTPHLPASR